MKKLILAAFTIWILIVLVVLDKVNETAKLEHVKDYVETVNGDNTGSIEFIDKAEPKYLKHIKDERLQNLINEQSAKHSLDPKLLACIFYVESSNRLEAVSHTQDYGIGQVNVATWKQYDAHKLVTDLRYSVAASAEILSFYKQLAQKDEPRTWACRYHIGGGSLTTKNRGARCELYLEKLNSCMLAE